MTLTNNELLSIIHTHYAQLEKIKEAIRELERVAEERGLL